MAKRLSPFATLSTLVVLGAVAVAWVSRGRQRPAGIAGETIQASAFSAEPFSADMTITKASGAVYHGKMFASGAATRSDVEMEPGKTASVIVRYDKRVSWVLMPAGHYLEAPLSNDEELFTLLRERSRKIERKDLGAAQVGKYSCEKYEISATVQGQRHVGYIWVAREPALHGFIVKAERGKPSETISFSNIRIGAPSAAEFEIPAGYHKLPNPDAGQQRNSH